MLVIRLLKALATPLILFAVLDAFLRTRIPAKKGVKLIAISLINATVAVTIGLTVANVLHAGASWQGKTGEIRKEIEKSVASANSADKAPEATLSPLENFSKLIPESIVDVFGSDSKKGGGIITVVLIAVLVGAALRKIKDHGAPETAMGIQTVESVIRTIFSLFTQMLEWIIAIIPFAVFGIVAKVVGQSGVGVFVILGAFLLTILLGLFLHAVIYYSLLLWAVGRTSPRRFYAGGFDAIVTALSCGSSVATLPVTLRCLNDNLKISPSSARLAACVGTNLNHDGIILYEAAAAIFMAQAFGYTISLEGQIAIALASVMAGIGIAGVPEAGLITLPLVLSAAGLPMEITAVVIPLVLPVDWIIGRCRAATNVISDMTVATLLDRFYPNEDKVA